MERFLIVLTSAKGKFYWDSYTALTNTGGWRSFMKQAQTYKMRHMAQRRANELIEDYGRIFNDFDISVVPCSANGSGEVQP